jgi:hypothetical protein
VEYVDDVWGGYDMTGSESYEQNTLVLTVTPQNVGDFFVEIRGTMRQNLAGCDWSNGLPAEGEGGFTDPQGWPVQRFRVQVTPPQVAYPSPVFTAPVEISSTTIAQGEAFTLRARVRNDGSDSDLGIVSVSFPSLTSGADGQWITPLSTGDDTPGYQELPAGSVIPDASCYYAPAAYMAVEYVDDYWKGILNGHERNDLLLSIRPPAAGTFHVYVRSALRETGSACAYRTGLPSNGEAGFVRFVFEATVKTDEKDERPIDIDLACRLAESDFERISPEVQDFFREAVRRAVLAEFQLFINAGNLKRALAQREHILREWDRTRGFIGMDI